MEWTTGGKHFMDVRFVSILVGIVVVLGGIFVFTQKSDNSAGGGSKNSSGPTNHVTGQSPVGVKLVEYGDYQCSVCFGYEPVMERVRGAFAKQIVFQFRNLPLISLHPNAFAGARAAEAADLQNKFWQMHDLLYKPANYRNWIATSDPQSLFEGYAKQLGLNLDKFKSDYSSGLVNDRINADLAEFKKTGQQEATPTFFLDGQYINNADLPSPQTDPNGTFNKFSSLIKAEIAKKSKS